MMLGTLAVFWLYDPHVNLAYAQTIAFSTLVIFQMFNVLNCRSWEKSLFTVGVFKNKKLIGAIIVSILMQMLVLYTPLNVYFKTVPISFMDWVYISLVSLSVILIAELTKLLRRVSLKYKDGGNHA
jgi:Ca2+-transporting ATPase